MEEQILRHDLDLKQVEHITKLLQDIMDIGIMFIICILVVACFIYYLWKIKPKLEVQKNLIIENNQKMTDSLNEVEVLINNCTQVMNKLNTTIETLHTSIVINDDKLSSIKSDIPFIKQDMDLIRDKLIELQIKIESLNRNK